MIFLKNNLTETASNLKRGKKLVQTTLLKQLVANVKYSNSIAHFILKET